jgi:uncharacterized membrane protein YoaT (DUF817 family)
LASSYSNLEKSPNFAKSNFAIWQTWWRRQMNLTKWPSKWHSILTQVNIFPNHMLHVFSSSHKSSGFLFM